MHFSHDYLPGILVYNYRYSKWVSLKHSSVSVVIKIFSIKAVEWQLRYEAMKYRVESFQYHTICPVVSYSNTLNTLSLEIW